MQIPISVPTAVSKSGDNDFGRGHAPSQASRLVLARQSLQKLIWWEKRTYGTLQLILSGV